MQDTTQAATVIVTIQVEDYARWRAAFDSADAMRRDIGIVIRGIYRAAEDENRLTLLSDYPSVEDAQRILSHPSWKEAQEKSGVIGSFEVQVLHRLL